MSNMTFFKFPQLTLKPVVNTAFDLKSDLHPTAAAGSAKLVLKQSSFDPALCNNLFMIDHQKLQQSDPHMDSCLKTAISMIDRPSAMWRGKVKLQWYKTLAQKTEQDLYINLMPYEAPLEAFTEDGPSPAASMQRFVFSVFSVNPPAPTPAPVLLKASDVPVDVPDLTPVTSREEAEHNERLLAQLVFQDNHATVTYANGQPVPEEAWHFTLPLFYVNDKGETVCTVPDILQPTRAHQLMNMRGIDDAQVDRMVKSIKDTPGMVGHAEKIGVLVCPTVYKRLNDLHYRGHLFQGLMLQDLCFPDDPRQAVLNGERHFIPITANHTLKAQVKVVKEAAANNRYDLTQASPTSICASFDFFFSIFMLMFCITDSQLTYKYHQFCMLMSG